MKKTALTYGLISGSAMAVMYVLLCLARNRGHFALSNLVMYTAVVLLFMMLFWGIKNYRDNALGGLMTFGKGFKIGLFISLVSALCYTIWWMILFDPLFKGFMAQHSAALVDKLKANGASVDVITAKKQEMLKQAELYRNPLFRAAIILIQAIPAEAILTVIASFALKKKRSNPA